MSARIVIRLTDVLPDSADVTQVFDREPPPNPYLTGGFSHSAIDPDDYRSATESGSWLVAADKILGFLFGLWFVVGIVLSAVVGWDFNFGWWMWPGLGLWFGSWAAFAALAWSVAEVAARWVRSRSR